MKSLSSRKLVLLCGIAAASLGSSNAAQAQAASAQLDELIVTAQKRAENVQDVPLSITAISGAEIEKAHILNFAQLTTVVPSLQFSTSNNVRNTTISLRGIGRLARTIQRPCRAEAGAELAVKRTSAAAAGRSRRFASNRCE